MSKINAAAAATKESAFQINQEGRKNPFDRKRESLVSN